MANLLTEERLILDLKFHKLQLMSNILENSTEKYINIVLDEIIDINKIIKATKSKIFQLKYTKP